MKILLIEDDTGTLEVIRFCLEIYIPGVQVLTTTLGFEGIKITKHATPDVVILDLGLPDIDGMQVLRSVRKFSNIPVIILTARTDEESITRAMRLGANEYILKPFDPSDLLSRIDNVIKNDKSARDITNVALENINAMKRDS
ncbi:MAG: response regulator transcription factor [Chloroflexi bacterium]|jgi:DNA-binding response OmpR family regulator|nr:response regulator transcription factor [Chloroflexota bacterium]MBT7082147.1 response regulator transcription factor [Chloroflexota bacterium]MBT7290788.1 response regulator transcription factor [Chloroflexota bacterium]